MKIGSIYSASDKALFDALNQGAVTVADMRQLFLTHGIIISRATARKELAAHFSRLVHDFDDFQSLAKLFDTGQRRERLASFRVQSTAQLEDFETAAHAIVQQLKNDSESASVSANEDGSLKLLVRYRTFHFNKSEFRQVEIKDAVISIEQEGGSFVIRGPQNDKVDEICRSLLTTIEKDVDSKLDVSEINLEAFTEPAQRTEFFIGLLDLVNGYKKHDVTDVFVYKPKAESKGEQDNEADEDSDEDEINLGVHISRASLKGEGVLESQEMQNLISRGFYISKIIWQAKRNSEIDSDKYEFEAQFSEPDTCTRFSYLVRGHYKYQGDQRHSTSRSQLSVDDDIELSKAIESAARASLIKLDNAA